MNPADPVPDVLGPPWVARTLPLRHADGGEVPAAPDVATLIHAEDAGAARRAVLYLPGFVDYFFQAGHAQVWAAAGYDFYGLDLRRSGRSTAGHPRPHDVRDLRVVQEEIVAALGLIRQAGARQVVLLGHSTGGLQAALFAHDHPGAVDAVVLNSPWLDHNGPWLERVALTAVLDRVGARWPGLRVGGLRSAYGRALHRGTGGEWDFDLGLKPHAGFPVRAGFFRAVRRAHAEVAAGLAIDAPVLVACSTRSGDPKHPGPADLTASDVVLDVRQMVARAPQLGPDVTVLQVPGGIHDLALSAPAPREYYARSVLEWLGRQLPPLD